MEKQPFRRMGEKEEEKKECQAAEGAKRGYRGHYKGYSPILAILNFLRTLCIQICLLKIGRILVLKDKPTEPSLARDTANSRINSNTFVSLKLWPESFENGNR